MNQRKCNDKILKNIRYLTYLKAKGCVMNSSVKYGNARQLNIPKSRNKCLLTCVVLVKFRENIKLTKVALRICWNPNFEF